MTSEQAVQVALQHHRAGNLQQAEAKGVAVATELQKRVDELQAEIRRSFDWGSTV